MAYGVYGPLIDVYLWALRVRIHIPHVYVCVMYATDAAGYTYTFVYVQHWDHDQMDDLKVESEMFKYKIRLKGK